MIEGSWNGTDGDHYASSLLYFSKKRVTGPDFELGASMNGGAPVKARYSVFDGNRFTIFLFEVVYIVQADVEPPRSG